MGFYNVNEPNIRQVIFSLEVTCPHPFAGALREYVAGDEPIQAAYLVTLDDDGTQGMLVTRPAGLSSLFYLQDGAVHQISIPGEIFPAGRDNRLMTRLYPHTHVIEHVYKLAFGQLEISTRLEYFSDEYLAYLFEGDEDRVAAFISQRDAHAKYAQEKYGLVPLPPPYLGHERSTEDQTAKILRCGSLSVITR